MHGYRQLSKIEPRSCLAYIAGHITFSKPLSEIAFFVRTHYPSPKHMPYLPFSLKLYQILIAEIYNTINILNKQVRKL